MINKKEYLRGIEAASDLVKMAAKENPSGDYILKVIREHLDDCENDDAEDISEDYILGYSDTLQPIADNLEKIGYKD